MSTKPTTHLELVEPLRGFLETITQELTEQKFVPAVREELKRLLVAIDNLQNSENTLQQIAHGVERLREVFAPAGTRLLEGVKEIESVMRGNADQLREKAGSVLTDLRTTHEQLEDALRSEAGLLQEQTSASREALSRTIADVESRLSGLTAHVETLCRRLDTEVSTVAASSEQSAAPVAIQAAAPASVAVEFPEELKTLIVRSEKSVIQQLEAYKKEIGASLKEGRGEDIERLTKIDQRISESLASVGDHVQEELNTAVSRLRDQIQTLILAEREAPRPTKKGAHAEPATAPSADDLTAALTASETRILREVSALQKSQKSDSNAEKILKEVADGLDEVSRKFVEKITTESQTIKESAALLQRLFTEQRDGERKIADQISLTNVNLDSLVKAARESQHFIQEDFRTTLSRLDTQDKLVEQKAEEDRRNFTELASALSRAEQAATSATDLAMADSRAQRERIEAGLKDLREKIERGQAVDSERVQEMLRRVAETWIEALESLRDYVQKTITGRTDIITSRLAGIENRLTENGQTGGAMQRDLQNELKRVSTAFDERVEALKTSSDAFSAGMQNHVQAISGEVSAMRAKQDQTLAVLRDAIRANYDDNAARLKEVIESAYDTFLKQTSSIPQSLDRYTHLIQSLHQGDQLALQGIASDTQNVLALSTEKFEQIGTDTTAMKKFFPLLDKKLEKQSAEMDVMRKAQVRQDQNLGELKSATDANRQAADEQHSELKREIQRAMTAADEGFESFRDDLGNLKSNLRMVIDENLPAFRRELNALVTSKFEFMETTLVERQEGLRKEIFDQLSTGRAAHTRTHLIIAGMIGLSILFQLLFHFARTPGVGH
jgi:hypothetical protein